MMVDLAKKAAAVGVSLAKKGINKAPVMRVGAALDVSTSMVPMIPTKLQKAFDQLMGVSIKFDDNGELDIFAFNHKCWYVGTATVDNHADYVKRKLRADGSTNYSPIIVEVRRFFLARKGGLFGLGGKVDRTPVLMMILTDGGIDPDDEARTLAELRALSDEPIFFHLVGVGRGKGSFPAIGRLAAALDNVGEVYLPDFEMTDEAIYDQLVSDKLVAWLRKLP